MRIKSVITHSNKRAGIFFLVVVLFFFSEPSQAMDPICLWQAFSTAYVRDYVCSYCSNNAQNLLQEIKAQGGDLNEFKVIFLRDTSTLLKDRNSVKPASWDWHVFAIHVPDGRVLDLDFSLTPGQPHPAMLLLGPYIASNYGSMKNLSGVRVRAVDAKYYAEMLDKQVHTEGFRGRPTTLNAGYFRNGDLGQFGADYDIEGFLRAFAKPVSPAGGRPAGGGRNGSTSPDGE